MIKSCKSNGSAILFASTQGIFRRGSKMAISDDLFLAILSMDAYNRGYAAGLGSGPLGLGDVGSQYWQCDSNHSIAIKSK